MSNTLLAIAAVACLVLYLLRRKARMNASDRDE